MITKIFIISQAWTLSNTNGYQLLCIINLAVPGNMCSIPI